MDLEYTLIRSRRRTISAQIKDGRIVVRAPYLAPRREIEAFLTRERSWIERNLAKARERERALMETPPLSEREIRELYARAREVIPQRAAFYAPQVGVTYGKITVRKQKARWGSCTQAGNLSFNCLLMLCPPQALDYVVVHELCHRLEMNHSQRFYAHVRRVFPEYLKWRRWLKENGPVILARGNLK